MTKIVAVILMQVMLSGCGKLFKRETVYSVSDPYCTAISTVKYSPNMDTLFLKEKETIRVQAQEINGVRVFYMTFDDYENIINVLLKAENYIIQQRTEIDSMIEYYDPQRFKE